MFITKCLRIFPLFFPDLTIMDDIKFLFIGESANMTCTMINKQTIQNYSVENLNIRVKKCLEIKSLYRQIGQKNGSKEIHVRDLIEDLPCRDQILLDYVCQYDRKNSSPCIVGRTFIYFDCKIKKNSDANIMVYQSIVIFYVIYRGQIIISN